MAFGYVTREGGALKFEYVIPEAEIRHLSPNAGGLCIGTMQNVLSTMNAARTPVLNALIQRDFAFIQRTRGEAALRAAMSWNVCLTRDSGVAKDKRSSTKSAAFAGQASTMVHERFHAMVDRFEADAASFLAVPKTDKTGFEYQQPIYSEDILLAELTKYYPKAVLLRMKKYALEQGWTRPEKKRTRSAGIVFKEDTAIPIEEIMARMASAQFFEELLADLRKARGDAATKPDAAARIAEIDRKFDTVNDAYDVFLRRLGAMPRSLFGLGAPASSDSRDAIRVAGEVSAFFNHARTPSYRAGWNQVPPVAKIVRDAFEPYLSAKGKFMASQPSFPKGMVVESAMPDFMREGRTQRKFGFFDGTATVVEAKISPLSLSDAGPEWLYTLRFPDGELVTVRGSVIIRRGQNRGF